MAKEKKEHERLTYNIEEAGAKLGLAKNAAYNAAHRNEIPVIKIGGRWLVPKAAFDKMLQGE